MNATGWKCVGCKKFLISTNRKEESQENVGQLEHDVASIEVEWTNEDQRRLEELCNNLPSYDSPEWNEY